jgi:rhomboid protease GluP
MTSRRYRPSSGNPSVTIALLSGLAALYLLSALLGGADWSQFINGVSAAGLAEIGGNARVLSAEQGQWWRLITATLLHGGIAHLVMNSFALWNLGSQLEEGIGWRELLFAYVVTGVSGSMMSTFFGNPVVVSIGASGAIFGLLGFLVAHGARNINELTRQLSRNGSTLVIALLIPFLIPNVDNWAHIGGVSSGLVMGYLYRSPPAFWRNIFGYGSALVLLLGALQIGRLALPLIRF